MSVYGGVVVEYLSLTIVMYHAKKVCQVKSVIFFLFFHLSLERGINRAPERGIETSDSELA